MDIVFVEVTQIYQRVHFDLSNTTLSSESLVGKTFLFRYLSKELEIRVWGKDGVFAFINAKLFMLALESTRLSQRYAATVTACDVDSLSALEKCSIILCSQLKGPTFPSQKMEAATLSFQSLC